MIQKTSSHALAPFTGLDERLFPTGFELWRSSLETLTGMRLLEALTSPINAEVCIQSLPVEDLHRFLIEIGLEDAEELLALAHAEQVREILDIELWDQASISLERVDVWLHALMRAGPEILFQRMLELDDEVLSWIVKTNAYAFVIEDPESFDPPDLEHLLTPDRRLCIVFPRSETSDLPTKLFLDQLMQANPELCIHLLLASTAALRSTLEEEAYRWRTARLSDRGFVEFYEAISIYSPPPTNWRHGLPPERIFETLPPAKTWLAQVVAPERRLDEAFAQLGWEEALTVAELLGYVANMMLSADRVQLWDADSKEKTLYRLRASLTIALERFNGPHGSPIQDAEVLGRHHLNYLFRYGYDKMTDAARPIWRVEGILGRGDDPSGALIDLPHLKSWADGLLKRHPEAQEGAPLRSVSDCEIAREGALIIEDLAGVAEGLFVDRLSSMSAPPAQRDDASSSSVQIDHQSVGLGATLLSSIARHILDLKVEIGPLSDVHWRTFHALCFEVGELTSSVSADVVTWWRSRGGETATAPLALLRELHEQVGGVDPQSLDARFVPLLWSTHDLIVPTSLDSAPSTVPTSRAPSVHLRDQDELSAFWDQGDEGDD